MDPVLVKIGSAVGGGLVILALIGHLMQDKYVLVLLALLAICGLIFLWADHQEKTDGGS